jgi:hypothetical protein
VSGRRLRSADRFIPAPISEPSSSAMLASAPIRKPGRASALRRCIREVERAPAMNTSPSAQAIGALTNVPNVNMLGTKMMSCSSGLVRAEHTLPDGVSAVAGAGTLYVPRAFRRAC